MSGELRWIDSRAKMRAIAKGCDDAELAFRLLVAERDAKRAVRDVKRARGELANATAQLEECWDERRRRIDRCRS